MTRTDIANLALSLIGGSPVASIDDPTSQARACKKWFDSVRDEALASHPWNFAMKRAIITPWWRSVALITNDGDNINVVSASGYHNLPSGSRVHVRGVRGLEAANGTWLIEGSESNLVLIGSVFSGAAVPWTGQWTQAPTFGWEYELALPTDCLRVCGVNASDAAEDDSDFYVLEGGKLLFQEEEAHLSYVSRVAEPTGWPPDFCNAFALLLASFIAQELMGPTGRAMELRQQYESVISPKIKGRDARQGKGPRVPMSHDCDVIRARRGGAATNA